MAALASARLASAQAIQDQNVARGRRMRTCWPPTSAQSELAEKFHMSPTLLRELNPRADFARAGTELTVANVPEMPLRSGRLSVEAVPPPNPPKASNDLPEVTIVVDKPARNVRVYDRGGKFLAFYPATIGSDEKPAPSGDFKVKGVSWNPKYEYDPKFAWKGVTTKRKLSIGPGAKQSRRPGLDRPDRSDLRNPWHAGAVGHRQDPVPWLHPPDELGRGRTGGDGPAGRCRPIRGSGLTGSALGGDGARQRDAAAGTHPPGTLVQAAFEFIRRRPSRTPFGAAAAILLLAASGAAPAVGAQAPKAHSPPPSPAPTGDAEPPLVSTSAMDESDHAQCVSELASKKVVFEQPKEATREGCRLSAPVSLTLVATPFGDVSLPAKPSMLCSFGLKFTDWVRDVAAPLTFAYTGQKLAEIETGPGFACTARYDKPGALPSEHAKGDAIDVVSFVLADKRRVTVKDPDPLVGALRMTACGYFTTVLGPGADPQHETHLHLDMLMHGGTANYRICE